MEGLRKLLPGDRESLISHPAIEQALVKEYGRFAMLDVVDDVLIVTLDDGGEHHNLHPFHDICSAICAELMAIFDTEVDKYQAVVLRGANGRFSCGTAIDAAFAQRLLADFRRASPTSLAEICRKIENCVKPVVAYLDGLVIGPAAELALAAHARLAHTQMRMIFPNVGLGLPPQAGASQRLPRLIGVKEACQCLINAQILTAAQALNSGLLERVIEGDAISHAIKVARSLTLPISQDWRETPDDFADVMAQNRASLANMVLPAPLRILECIESSFYLPFENGLELEAAAYEDLMASPEADALMSLAKSEQRAEYFPKQLGGETHQNLRYLGVLGGGRAQAGLVLLALAQGRELFWYDHDPMVLQDSFDLVVARLVGEEKAGRIAPGMAQFAMKRLHRCDSLDQMRLSQIILRGQDPSLAELSESLKQVTLLPQIMVLNDAARHENGGVVLGLSVAPSLKLAEIAVPKNGLSTSGSRQSRPVAGAMQLARALGVNAVLVGDRPKIGREVFAAGRQAMQSLYDGGVPSAKIIQALAQFGQTIPVLLPNQSHPSPPTHREMTSGEIIQRWLAAMANKGLALCETGDLCQSTDIDVIMVQGYGFPRWQGGPMYQARKRELKVMRADLLRWQDECEIWQPAQIIEILYEKGMSLETHLDR